MSAVDGIPRSVILINWIFLLLSIGCMRMAARWLFTKRTGLKNSYHIGADTKRVLVYGAGESGIQLVGALKYSFEYEPVGFIDDSFALQDNDIGGLNVYSPNNIGDVIDNLNVDEVLIAMPSTSRSQRQNIINAFKSYSVIVRVLPSLSDLAGGKVSVED
jgi:FlaA1/EpsC-like NDP-sugar epimerase